MWCFMCSYCSKLVLEFIFCCSCMFLGLFLCKNLVIDVKLLFLTCFQTVVWEFKMFRKWEGGLIFFIYFLLNCLFASIHWPISLNLDITLFGKYCENYRLSVECAKCSSFDFNGLLLDHFPRIRFHFLINPFVSKVHEHLF